MRLLILYEIIVGILLGAFLLVYIWLGVLPANAYVVASAIEKWQSFPVCKNKTIINQQKNRKKKQMMYACQQEDGKRWIEIRNMDGSLDHMLFKDIFEYNEFMLEWREDGSN